MGPEEEGLGFARLGHLAQQLRFPHVHRIHLLLDDVATQIETAEGTHPRLHL